jgi:hypothetical protein
MPVNKVAPQVEQPETVRRGARVGRWSGAVWMLSGGRLGMLNDKSSLVLLKNIGKRAENRLCFGGGVATSDLPGRQRLDPFVFHELFVALLVQFSDWKRWHQYIPHLVYLPVDVRAVKFEIGL